MARILVVEDDPSTATLIENILKSENYDVTVANHARAALDLFARERPDLVLTDMQMPGMSGSDLLASLPSEIQPRVPVCLITGEGLTEDRLVGFTAVLRKPFGIDQLLGFVRREWRR
jgi:DNA-binding response OmpR family regulator